MAIIVIFLDTNTVLGAYVPNHFVSADAPVIISQSAYNACVDPATPCSLICATTYAVAGDVVKVAPGVYNAPLGNNRWNPGFGIANNGTAGNPIIFFAEYPAALNYDSVQFFSLRSELRNGGTTAENAHPVIGTPSFDSPAKYVILDGFYINGAPGYAPAAPSGGSVNISTRGHFTVRNFAFDVFHLGSYDNFVPIFIQPNGEVPAVGPIILENNLFVGGGGSGYNQNASCVTTYAANNFIFQNNEFRNVNNGFYIKGYGNGGIIRYNKAINPSGNLAQINSIRDGLTVSVYQNIVINPGGSGFFYGMSPPGTRRGARVYNNTIIFTTTTEANLDLL